MPGKKDKANQRPIESYTHSGKQRANNPPVGLVTAETDPDGGVKKNLCLRPTP